MAILRTDAIKTQFLELGALPVGDTPAEFKRFIEIERDKWNKVAQTNNIKFLTIENNQLLAFYKWNQSRTNELLIIISLDHYYSQKGTVQLPLNDLNEKHLMWC